MPRIELPPSVPERTVPDLLARNAAAHADKTALLVSFRDGAGKRVTYGELAAGSARLAGALASRGIAKGDRVGILLSNEDAIEAHLSYHASHRIGAINVPLNGRYIAREMEYVLKFAGVKAVIFGSRFGEILRQIRGDVPASVYLEVGDAPATGECFRGACEASTSAPEPAHLLESDDADWIFTSGTTGNPKAVALTHANSVACGYQSTGLWGIDESSVFQSSAPFYTSTGCHTNLLACLAAGCTYVVEVEFDARESMRRIGLFRTTSVFLVSSMLQLIFNRVSLDEFDLSSLRRIAYGGMILPRPFYFQVDKEFREKRGIDLVHLYGLTEGGTSGTLLPPELHADALSRADRCGLSIGTRGFNEWISFRVVDEEDREASPGEVGEICLRAPSVMDRYVGDPEATAAALRNGWLHTGDMGTIDRDGYLYFVDRKKQIIRRGGMNISSAEVEGVIGQHPAVEEVAVVSRPNPVLGEDVKAVVALKSGREATAEEIIEFAKKDLADYKVPVEVRFVGRLPRNAMGRVMKGILRGESGGLQDA